MCHPYEDLGVEQIHSIDDNLSWHSKRYGEST